MRTLCQARVTDDWHHYGCQRAAKYQVGSRAISVCGIHKRVADKWAEEERLDSMIDFWWRPQ